MSHYYVTHYFIIKNNRRTKPTVSSMNKVTAFLEDYPSAKIAGAILVGASCSRLHVLRYLRKYSVPGTVMFFVYRHLLTIQDDAQFESVLNILKRLFLNDSKKAQNLTGDIIGLMIIYAAFSVSGNALSMNSASTIKFIQDQVFSVLKYIPYVQKQVQQEKDNLQKTLQHDLKEKTRNQMGESYVTLPEKGIDPEKMIEMLKAFVITEDVVWRNGKVSGSVYHGLREHQDILNKAFCLYSMSNPLHPEVWPSAMKFDSEIISMAASIVNGGVSTVCGR